MLWFFWTLPILLQRWFSTCLVCVHTLTPRENRVRNIFKNSEKTQYLMNILYILCEMLCGHSADIVWTLCWPCADIYLQGYMSALYPSSVFTSDVITTMISQPCYHNNASELRSDRLDNQGCVWVRIWVDVRKQIHYRDTQTPFFLDRKHVFFPVSLNLPFLLGRKLCFFLLFLKTFFYKFPSLVSKRGSILLCKDDNNSILHIPGYL